MSTSDAAQPAPSPAISLLAQILAAIQTGNAYLKILVAAKQRSDARREAVAGKLGGAEIDQFVALWNRVCQPLPEVKSAKDPVRRRRIMDCLRLTDGDMMPWERAIVALANSPWHRGGNDTGWVANIDFMLQPAQRTKWLEKGADETRRGAPAVAGQPVVWCSDAECKSAALFGPGTRNEEMATVPLCGEHWEQEHGEPEAA